MDTVNAGIAQDFFLGDDIDMIAIPRMHRAGNFIDGSLQRGFQQFRRGSMLFKKTQVSTAVATAAGAVFFGQFDEGLHQQLFVIIRPQMLIQNIRQFLRAEDDMAYSN